MAKLLAFFCRTDLLCLQAAVRASWIWGAVRERAKLSLAFCSVWAEGEEGRHKQLNTPSVLYLSRVPSLSCLFNSIQNRKNIFAFEKRGRLA